MQSRVGTERSVAFALTNTALAIAPAATIGPYRKGHMKPCATAYRPSRSPIVHLYVKTPARIPPGDDHKIRGRVSARPGEPRERRGGLTTATPSSPRCAQHI
jgi:hypothetical protein